MPNQCTVNGEDVTSVSFRDGRIYLNGSSEKVFIKAVTQQEKEACFAFQQHVEKALDSNSSSMDTRNIRVYDYLIKVPNNYEAVYLNDFHDLVWLRDFGCYVFKNHTPTQNFIHSRTGKEYFVYRRTFNSFSLQYLGYFDLIYSDYEGTFITKEGSIFIDAENRYITRGEYEDRDYFQCDHCCEHYSEDEYYGYGVCIGCHENEYGDSDDYVGDEETIRHLRSAVSRAGGRDLDAPITLHGFIDKSVRKHNNGAKRYFGVELELEFQTDPSDKYSGKQLKETFDKYWAFVSDGSLNDGIELVSAPMGINCIREAAKHLFSSGGGWVKDCCDDESTGGLHVHVSRDSIKETTITDLKKFFYYNENNSRLDLLVGRVPNRWCSRDKDYRIYKSDNIGKRKKHKVYFADKYQAVNIIHDKTIEFRCFGNTMDVDILCRRVQFCDALIEYLSEKPLTASKGLYNLDSFIKWLKDGGRYHFSLWPELFDYMSDNEKKVIPIKRERLSYSTKSIRKKLRKEALQHFQLEQELVLAA